MKKTNKRGFTIVELVIVIAVIAILASVMIPGFTGIVTKANESEALQDVKNAYTATLIDDYNFGADATIIVVHSNGTIISIVDGAASVVSTGEATHTLNDGKLVAVGG